jgi:hypothetical protein
LRKKFESPPISHLEASSFGTLSVSKVWFTTVNP